MIALPNCPCCKRNTKVVPDGDRNFRCNRCGILFDNDPNEGGTASTDPTWRAQVQDEQAARRRQQVGVRR